MKFDFSTWSQLIEESEPLLDKRFKCTHTEETYVFVGLVHASDDFYYLMMPVKSGPVVLASCVGTLETNGYELVDNEKESDNEKGHRQTD